MNSIGLQGDNEINVSSRFRLFQKKCSWNPYYFYGFTHGIKNQTQTWSMYRFTEAGYGELKTSQWFGNNSVFECNPSSCIPFCHYGQVTMSAVQRPGFQSTRKTVWMQDNKRHKGLQQGLALTHAPIILSTACILFQTLLSSPHTPWENICFCAQFPIPLPHMHVVSHEHTHTHTPCKQTY